MYNPKVPLPNLPAPKEEDLTLVPKREGKEVGLTKGSVIVQLSDGEEVYELPSAIYAIWSRCDGEETIRSLASTLSEETAIPMERMIPLTYAILIALAESNLIHWL